MNNEWGKIQERKRNLVSWGSTLVMYLAAFLVLLVLSLFTDTMLADTAGPIKIRLGVPEGLEEVTVAQTTMPETAASPEPEPEVKPEPVPVKETPTPVAAAKSKPAEKPVPKPETKPEAKTDTTKSVTTPAAAVTTPAPVAEKPQPAMIKGSEKGNTLDMAFNANAGQVGRNLYVPIYLFLPLPKTLEAVAVERFTTGTSSMYTREERIKIVSRYYEKDGLQFRLVSQPSFAERPEVWLALESAGFKIDKADYKTGRSLKPVQLKFVIGVYSGGTVPLKQLDMTGSSGDPEIDEAVMYGFRRASFFNSTDHDISGTFSYTF